MMPDNALSAQPEVGDFLPPADRDRLLLVDYQIGGVDLNDQTLGLEYQTWELYYSDPEVRALGDNALGANPDGSHTLFSIAGLKEISLAFDQNMNPFVAYIKNDDSAWYWWFDTQSQIQQHTAMEAGVISPRCILDDTRPKHVATSDIILAYTLNGNFYFRMQRTSYETEYLLKSNSASKLNKVGIKDSTDRRVQFEFFPEPVVEP